MTTRTIAVVVGSIARESINRRLAQALVALAPPALRLSTVRIDDLPLYTQDHDAAPPPAAVRFKDEIAAADGVLFVTPEHNRGIPAALKNALDWGSRPHGQNVWAGRPGGMLGASPGALGTAVAQQQLRTVLCALDVPTLAQPQVYVHYTPELVDGEGRVTNERTRAVLQSFLGRYAAWVERFAVRTA